MLTVTHNHSAPLTLSWGCLGQERRDRAWENKLIGIIAETVAVARTALAPAKLYAGRTEYRLGVNRREIKNGKATMGINPSGPTAPWLDVLRVDRAAGGLRAVLMTHAAHPVIVHRSATGWNADYPGAATRTVRGLLPDQPVVMFVQGCARDLNAQPLGGGLAAAEAAGAGLGEAAARTVLAAAPLSVGPLRTGVKRVQLPFAPSSEAEVEAELASRQRALAEMIGRDAGAETLYDARDNAACLERRLSRLRRGELPSGQPFEAQAIACGRDLVLLALSGEPFVAYQLFAEARSSFRHTMVFGYANCSEGYLPTAADLPYGGYETVGAPRFFSVPPLASDCEDLIKAAVEGLLTDLWQ